MTERHSDVSAVVVTYGSRSDFCVQVIESAWRCGVGSVLVVDNGADEQSRAALLERAARGDINLRIVHLPSNEGSAAGFGAGIRAAMDRPTTSYAWLLDDDNAPAPDALQALFAARATIKQTDARPHLLLSYRNARPLQRAVASGHGADDAFPSRGGFSGFNLRDAIPRVIGVMRPRRRPDSPRAAPATVEIPYGPYGGLLLPRCAVDSAGLPDARLDTYEDDADYTRRLVTAGYPLTLVPASEVTDLEDSWYTQAKGRTPFTRRLLTPSERRSYLMTRNRIIFERRHWSGSAWLYHVNRAVFVTGLLMGAVTTRRWTRLRVLLHALRSARSDQWTT